MTIIKGLTLKDSYLIKLTNKDEDHNGFKYKTGINIDHNDFNPNGDCSKGGLYFAELQYIQLVINRYFKYGKPFYIRRVRLENNEDVYVEKYKYKANKIILEEAVSLTDFKIYDPEICKLAIQNNGCALYYVSSEIKEYSDLCKLAVQNDGSLLYYVSRCAVEVEEYLEICKLAVQNNGYSLRFVSSEIEGYLEICKLAVQKNGCALEYVSRFAVEVERYLEICKLAVQNNVKALKYVSFEVEGYSKICKWAVKNDSRALRYVSRFAVEVEEYSKICKLAVKNNGRTLKYISPEVEGYSKICKLASAKRQNDICTSEYVL